MAAQWYPPVMDSAAQENSESRLGHPPGSTASYAYDAFGRRAEKIVGSRTTDYLYDAFGHASYEVNNLCAPVCIDTGFFYLGGQLVAEYKEGLTYFVHTDHIGSTRLVTGLNQTVAQNLDYLPFGEQNSTDSGISTHEFTGDIHDAESDLDHAQFRQYSSSLGRWMHPDPAGLAAVDPSNPQSWNRYAYVDDDPLNLTDSSGLYPVCLGSSLFDQVDFYVDEKYQGSDLTYIGNLCGDQGQRLPPAIAATAAAAPAAAPVYEEGAPVAAVAEAFWTTERMPSPMRSIRRVFSPSGIPAPLGRFTWRRRSAVPRQVEKSMLKVRRLLPHTGRKH